MIIERLAARWVFHSKQLVIVHLDEKGSSNTNGNPFWVLRSLSMILCCLVRLVLFFFFFILSTPPPEVLRLFYPALLLTWVHILPFFSALCASKREALVGGWAMSCVSSVCSPPVLSLSLSTLFPFLSSISIITQRNVAAHDRGTYPITLYDSRGIIVPLAFFILPREQATTLLIHFSRRRWGKSVRGFRRRPQLSTASAATRK
jgi:hypothetical protein